MKTMTHTMRNTVYRELSKSNYLFAKSMYEPSRGADRLEREQSETIDLANVKLVNTIIRLQNSQSKQEA